MLEKEFEYYLSHQEELLKKYEGKVIVIIGNEIVGSYNDKVTAFEETKKTYKPGKFLIQLCSPGSSGYTQTFYSRVSF